MEQVNKTKSQPGAARERLVRERSAWLVAYFFGAVGFAFGAIFGSLL